jgi:hypothetical protein
MSGNGVAEPQDAAGTGRSFSELNPYTPVSPRVGGGAAPTLATVAPTTGPGGTTCTLTGTNFPVAPAQPPMVTFGGAPAVLTSNTATSIVCTAPPTKKASTVKAVSVATLSGQATLPTAFTAT